MDCHNLATIHQTIQTAILIMAVFVAMLSIWWHRKTTKQENTIKLLMQDLNDDLIKNGIKLLEEIDQNQKDSIEIYANKDNKHSQEAIDIRNLLNYYEMLSVGVNKGIYDIDMIKKAQKTMISKIYQHSEAYIKRRRKTDSHPSLYAEFEQLFIKLNQK